MKIKKWKNSRRHPPTCSTLFRPRFMGTFFGVGKIVWKSAVGFFVSLPFRERKRGREGEKEQHRSRGLVQETRGDRRWEMATERSRRSLSQAAAPSPAWQLVHPADSLPLAAPRTNFSRRHCDIRCEKRNESAANCFVPFESLHRSELARETIFAT